jgi:hypothetical protein
VGPGSVMDVVKKTVFHYRHLCQLYDDDDDDDDVNLVQFSSLLLT